VFSGEVVEIEKRYQKYPRASRGYRNTATLRVSEVWKGPQRETLEVSTAGGPAAGAACGYPFKEGQVYLVFADEGKQGLQVDSCGGTQRLTEAQADLEVLGNGETMGGSGVLSDTSGGFPPLGLIGMLGGAVAAVSLAVLMRLVRAG